jgi:putative flippase GtrA
MPRNAAAKLFVSDLVGYAVCSAAALALDSTLLILLVKLGMNYLIATAISFTAGMVLAYVGSVIFAFRGRRAGRVSTEIAGFFLIGLAGLACNQLLLFLFVHFCGLEVGIAKAPTAVCVFLSNFLLRRTLLFASAQNGHPA